MLTLNEAELLAWLDEVVAVQIFTDGGLARGTGAAALVVFCIRDQLETSLLEARGWHMVGTRSAFHAEVSALDKATELLSKISRQKTKTPLGKPVKRVRFAC